MDARRMDKIFGLVSNQARSAGSSALIFLTMCSRRERRGCVAQHDRRSWVWERARQAVVNRLIPRGALSWLFFGLLYNTINTSLTQPFGLQ